MDGTFQSFKHPFAKGGGGTLYWLKDGTMSIPNGDVWKGSFYGFELVRKGKGKDEMWECNFRGTISREDGEVKKGLFRCMDNNVDFVVKSFIPQELE